MYYLYFCDTPFFSLFSITKNKQAENDLVGYRVLYQSIEITKKITPSSQKMFIRYFSTNDVHLVTKGFFYI